MMICVHCADYDSRFSSVHPGFHSNVLDEIFSNDEESNVIAAEPSLRNEQEAMKLEILVRWLSILQLESYADAAYSGSSTQQSPELTLVRKKLRGALGSSQIFMRMAYLNENFLLVVYANLSAQQYMHIDCISQDDAGRLLSA